MDRFLNRADLRTYDPYDIWKTALGFRAKDLYNRAPLTSLPLVVPITLADHLFNLGARAFYKPAEYPIVRAMASLSLLNRYQGSGDVRLLQRTRLHLDWLISNSCIGYSGHCWGLGFRYPVRSDIIYDANTPLTTMTPYALEAFDAYTRLSGDSQYRPVIASIMNFFDRDVQIMYEDGESMATSYAPHRDRIVVNAVSYTMLANAVWLEYCSPLERPARERKIRKLYSYIRRVQRSDGSWFYSTEGRPFVDCFHTCIVLKNIFKTRRVVSLDASGGVLDAGYTYLKRAFLDERRCLFRRFSLSNKPGLVRFDLYDNAEALSLGLLLGDRAVADRLLQSTLAAFCDGLDVYSQIDFLGHRRNRNTLRWAVMPFLLAASQTI